MEKKPIIMSAGWYCTRCGEMLNDDGTHWCLPERIDKIIELLSKLTTK